jgi:hypothetical protein
MAMCKEFGHVSDIANDRVYVWRMCTACLCVYHSLAAVCLWGSRYLCLALGHC